MIEHIHRIWIDREARFSLVGLACVAALLASGPLLMAGHAQQISASQLPPAWFPTSAGAVLGSLVACLQPHPYRRLGLIPPAILGLAVVLLSAPPTYSGDWFYLAFGCAGGLACPPLYLTFRDAVPAETRRTAVYLTVVMSILLTGGVLACASLPWVSIEGLPGTIAGLTGTATLVLFWKLRRPVLEQLAEIVLAPIYRIRAHGPGVEKVPRRGPLLVIANHTAWFDPLWLGKVLPRAIIPMMGSDFYDLPIIRQLMIYVVGTIRVQTSAFRREAPELQEAITVLDQGGCVVLFPEGRLRRMPEPSVRQFGRGVWHILHERPQTPVVVCWIEGGWGSFASYADGKPMRNKWPDWWRSIDIGISEPQVLDPELLQDHRATRTYLMRVCLHARSYLGLEVPGLNENDDDNGP